MCKTENLGSSSYAGNNLYFLQHDIDNLFIKPKVHVKYIKDLCSIVSNFYLCN